ncbi:MAG: cytochrome C oxidase subunit IV family protein [Planctomycetaceae bacterium]|nr:cytochrome C oxidase subunit IV family protein [Planctomycetaceae bacterium]
MNDVPSAEAHDSHGSSKIYVIVFAILCACTAASWLIDELHIDSTRLLIVTVLAIASLKASFVMLYFMHLKFEKNWKYALLLPTTILAIGLPLTLLPDIGMQYYRNVNPQAMTTVEEATSETADIANTTEEENETAPEQ